MAPRHQVIPDRIEAGSYIAMAAAIGKGIKVKKMFFMNTLKVLLLNLKQWVFV